MKGQQASCLRLTVRTDEIMAEGLFGTEKYVLKMVEQILCSVRESCRSSEHVVAADNTCASRGHAACSWHLKPLLQGKVFSVIMLFAGYGSKRHAHAPAPVLPLNSGVRRALDSNANKSTKICHYCHGLCFVGHRLIFLLGCRIKGWLGLDVVPNCHWNVSQLFGSYLSRTSWQRRIEILCKI